MLNNNRIIDYWNLFSFSFSFLHYRFLKWPREYCIDCSRKRRAARVLLACWLLSYTLDTLSLAPHRPPTLFTVVNCMSWSGRKLAGADAGHSAHDIYVHWHNGRIQDIKPTAVTCYPSLSSKNAWNSDLAHVISSMQGSCK